jgi:transaldolase
MPMETVDAYRDHGKPAARITDELTDAQRKLVQLKEVGLDLAAATKQLEDEGVKKFVEPFDKLLASLDTKRKAVLAGAGA